MIDIKEYVEDPFDLFMIIFGSGCALLTSLLILLEVLR